MTEPPTVTGDRSRRGRSRPIGAGSEYPAPDAAAGTWRDQLAFLPDGGTFAPGCAPLGHDPMGLDPIRHGGRLVTDNDVVRAMTTETVLADVDWAYGAEVEDFVSEWAGLPYEDELPIGGAQAVVAAGRL